MDLRVCLCVSLECECEREREYEFAYVRGLKRRRIRTGGTSSRYIYTSEEGQWGCVVKIQTSSAHCLA